MRRLRDVAIVLFLAVQVALALRGLLLDKLETRGNFSWNMYSGTYRCTVGYATVGADGRLEPFDHRAEFVRPERASMVFHRDTLPRFHRHVCERIGADRFGVELRGSVVCGRGDERVALVATPRDLCTADDHGVAPR